VTASGLRFLVDNACSPKLAQGLRNKGFDAVHVLERDAASDADSVQLDRAVAEGRVLVTADTDFGTLLAMRGAFTPSVVQFRRRMSRRADAQLEVLLAQLPALADDLRQGALVTIEDARVRIRRLPIIQPR